MKQRSVLCTSILALSAVLAATVARAPASTPSSPALGPLMDRLFAANDFEQAAISPDGKEAAWVEWLHEADGAPSYNSAIYVEDLSSPAVAAPSRRISADPATPHAERSLSWSPDGKRLVFLSDAAEAGQFQLYVADAASGAPNVRKLTDLRGNLAEPRWSPDGKSIAVLFIANAPRLPGPLEPMTAPSGEIELHPFEQRLAVVDAVSGKVREVSPADLYVYEYDWSPDSRKFVTTAAHGSGDNDWWVAELYTIDVASGEARSIYKPSLQIAVPRWSPDGRSIAFIQGLMSDAGSNGGDVWVVPAAGGQARDLTPGMKASASWLSWLSNGKILFAEDVDGESGVATVDPSGAAVETVWRAAEAISTDEQGTSLSLAADGRTSAVIRESFSSPPEIWAGTLGAWRQLTHANQDVEPTWGKAESLHWSGGGLMIQGWLLYPRDYDPSRRYPLVVEVHGGPGYSFKPVWPETFFNTSLLSSLGYFVLYPNPRGSFGQGERFTQANVKDFGYGDLRDILAGVDEVVKTLPVDPQRVGITGWSYGGYMSMWAVTQSHRFRAAVAGAGIADWQSYYGENDIDQWMIPFFGASVYDDPGVYARSSPVTYIKNAKTPTLVLVGDRDGECPAPQSFEFWHALKALDVPTRLVVYPGEGHDIYRATDRRDIIERTVGWFGEYLKSKANAAGRNQ